MKKISIIIILLISTLYINLGYANPSNKVQVLISFKSKINSKLISNVNGSVKHELKNLPIVVAEIPQEAIQALQKNKDIDFIEEDGVWSATSQITPWGISQINADIVQATGITGKGIKVGILDSGVSFHEDLNIIDGLNFVDKKPNYADEFGHGTHVTGIIGATNNAIGVVGVSPDVSLYSLKVLDAQGSTNWSTVAKAIDWSITNNINILNMSFGGSIGSKTIEKILNKAYSSGILLVAAAGNYGNNSSVIYPAKYSTVIAVGAIDENINIAPFSNTGPELELVAPGLNILSTYIGNTYFSMSGTSMAAPHVTGTAALIWSKNPLLTNSQVRERLHKSAVDLGALGRDDIFGYGLINASTAIQ